MEDYLEFCSDSIELWMHFGIYVPPEIKNYFREWEFKVEDK